ncbi:MAG: nucleotide-binding protein [Rhodospirillales bacterium]|nr:nucleotide-binding protein [Rhodospirillales bacterium]
MSKTRAIERLEELVNEASDLDPHDHRSQEFKKWTESVNSAFVYIFGEDSRQFSRLPGSHAITPSGIRNHLNDMVSVVESNLEDVKCFWEEEEPTVRPIDRNDCSTLNFDRREEKRKSNRVFVIHGHDEAVRETVARFLEKLGLEPVILHEQANKGRTIIEKFEDHADVAFAVVLLTPDDMGGLKDRQTELKPRARQNVILELGFFLGKLDRQQVCPLVKDDVETPSDYDGVVYTRLDDAGAWKMKLVQELKAAGFDVDANKVIQT